MKLNKFIITCSMVTVLTSAALPAYSGDNIAGTLLGAAGGAAIGSNIGKGKGKIAAVAIGTLLGAGIGNSIQGGNVYAADYHDHSYYGHSYRHYRRNYLYERHHPYYYNHEGYPASQQSYWVNPDYGQQVVQVNNNYQAVQQPQPETEYCREFNQNVKIGGKMQPGYGVACLQPDGSWQIKK